MTNYPVYDIKEAITETTGEVDGFTYPAHTYYLSANKKMVGFKSAFTGELKFFSKTMSFDKRRRTFVKAEIPSEF